MYIGRKKIEINPESKRPRRRLEEALYQAV
jgi:hypothetical protein